MATANSPEQAKKDAQNLGILLRKVFVLNPDLNFHTAQEFAQVFAELLGYRDMKVGIPFIQALIEVLISTESPEELKEKYAQGTIGIEALVKGLQKAIEGPKDS